jgi:hypothetical protein
MGPTWTDGLRFAPGTRLRFITALPSALRAALMQARPSLQEWMERLDAAVLTVLSVERDRCTMQASVNLGALCHGKFCAEPDPRGGYRVRVEWHEASEPRVRDFDAIALMLGGERDVYLAQRTDTEIRQLSRWHYQPDGSVLVSIFPRFFSDMVPAVVRALLPTELPIGALQPVRDADGG